MIGVLPLNSNPHTYPAHWAVLGNLPGASPLKNPSHSAGIMKRTLGFCSIKGTDDMRSVSVIFLSENRSDPLPLMTSIDIDQFVVMNTSAFQRLHLNCHVP